MIAVACTTGRQPSPSQGHYRKGDSYRSAMSMPTLLRPRRRRNLSTALKAHAGRSEDAPRDLCHRPRTH
jgi:hypothetical protein